VTTQGASYSKKRPIGKKRYIIISYSRYELVQVDFSQAMGKDSIA